MEKYSKENEFLIRETNHRVNNNLQLISLLISETLRKKQSEENKKDFIRLQAKVDSIALLHRYLYTSNNVNTVNLKKYLTEVKNNFSPVEYEQKLKVNLEIDTIEIQSDYAMYIGLLITELVINSIKHAFDKTQEKIIQIKLIKEEKGVIFDYQDNGKNAIDKTIQPKLVNQLCQQLLVNSIIETQNGFHLNFKLNL
ncbi:MAG: sensor histidine kinase [Flavobacterium sp.]|nr:sensor histidine kinase [Flavobacterium sp.]